MAALNKFEKLSAAECAQCAADLWPADPRCPEEPLRENEAAAVYEALEAAKAELRRIKNSAKYAGGAWASYVADDALSKINDIMKGAR